MNKVMLNGEPKLKALNPKKPVMKKLITPAHLKAFLYRNLWFAKSGDFL
jgi:hypothetical protein